MITPVNTPVAVPTPNAVMVPTINITTRINSTGGLQVSAIISLQSAFVSTAGVWQAVGRPVGIMLPDINNLPTDLAALAAQFGTIETDIINIVSSINTIRMLV